jgi:hypothetical protein
MNHVLPTLLIHDLEALFRVDPHRVVLRRVVLHVANGDLHLYLVSCLVLFLLDEDGPVELIVVVEFPALVGS